MQLRTDMVLIRITALLIRIHRKQERGDGAGTRPFEVLFF